MKRYLGAVFALGLAAAAAGTAQAAVIDLSMTASVSGFNEGQTDFSGLHFDQYSVWVDSAGLPVTVAQGDTINATVVFDGLVTIPASQVRTDLVTYFSGTGFPSVNTGVNGTYTFYDGATLVKTFGFSSTTSGGLASFAAVFPPNNVAFTFDSFTDNFLITDLATPGTLDHASFTYSLVSNLSPVPEPSAWMLMLGGLGLVGLALRRRGGAVLRTA